jgi:transcriptional regulator with XRE-family HTH domain
MHTRIMSDRGQLGDFLQTRRSQLRPEDVGLETYGDRRRVAGLRREELALLAGVSVSYYTRLEQGHSLNASPEILDAIAKALRFNDSERRHLQALAATPKLRGGTRRPPPERVAAATSELLAALGDVPAIVLGRRTDVLAWNRAGHALFAGHLDPDGPSRPAERPNMARLVFLDAHTRELYADWPSKARAIVGNLRLAAGRHPDDALLAKLLGELSMVSGEFASMWSDHRVKADTAAGYELCHPLVGSLILTLQTLHTDVASEQYIVVATAAVGSSSQAALGLLTQATTDSARPGVDVHTT